MKTKNEEQEKVEGLTTKLVGPWTIYPIDESMERFGIGCMGMKATPREFERVEDAEEFLGLWDWDLITTLMIATIKVERTMEETNNKIEGEQSC